MPVSVRSTGCPGSRRSGTGQGREAGDGGDPVTVTVTVTDHDAGARTGSSNTSHAARLKTSTNSPDSVYGSSTRRTVAAPSPRAGFPRLAAPLSHRRLLT